MAEPLGPSSRASDPHLSRAGYNTIMTGSFSNNFQSSLTQSGWQGGLRAQTRVPGGVKKDAREAALSTWDN